MARGDWQVAATDVATLSFASNISHQDNQGVSGLTLAEAGYSSQVSENTLRFTNALIPGANCLNETRIGYTWKRTHQLPLSTVPALQVAGYFQGGGATSQNLDDREHDLEVDDNLLIMHGRQEWKVGVQSLDLFAHDYDPDTFNGAYVFSGGSASELDGNNQPTGQTTTVNPLEQYRRAQENLPGGTPTNYLLTRGNPVVPLTQWQVAMFLQDRIRLSPRFSVHAGLRYALQTASGSLTNFAPRIALSWSPDRKQAWTFQARADLFNGTTNLAYAIEAHRLDGERQQRVNLDRIKEIYREGPDEGRVVLLDGQNSK